jgi:class 3 adenylate cyclase
LARAKAAGADLAARATTRRQLRLICNAHDIDEAVLEALAPPAVICYAGHIICAPGAAGRFPAAQEDEVAQAIAALLEKRRVGFGYGALAAGADILFAEALLARGAELHVVLPFARDEFIEVSVAPAGGRWRERFTACLESARTVTYATSDSYLGHDALFAYGSIVTMGLAVLRGRFLDAEVRQAAVWDGEETTGPAGTGFDVRTWRALGRASDIISCRPAASEPTAKAREDGVKGRALRALLFGDVKGFSKLKEAQIPLFVEHILEVFGSVLTRYGKDVLHSNTWGDGLYVVLSGPEVGARCAIDLREAFGKIDLVGVGLPDFMAFRIGGHFGPVFELWDPVLKADAYMGAHVSRTARIEPVTPPGEVYVTEQFAARLALEGPAYDCNYVGVMPAAKDFGVMRMYHLDAR